MCELVCDINVKIFGKIVSIEKMSSFSKFRISKKLNEFRIKFLKEGKG